MPQGTIPLLSPGGLAIPLPTAGERWLHGNISLCNGVSASRGAVS